MALLQKLKDDTYCRFVLTMGWVGLALGCLESANLIIRRGLDLTLESLFHLLLYYYPSGLILGGLTLILIIPLRKRLGGERRALVRVAFVMDIVLICAFYLNTNLLNINLNGLTGAFIMMAITIPAAIISIPFFRLIYRTGIMKTISQPAVAMIYASMLVAAGLIEPSTEEGFEINVPFIESPPLASIDSVYNHLSHKPSIIFILADALRADYPGEDFGELNTPNLKSLADDGITFTNAFSSCSWTLPSVCSIFSGHYPATHGVHYHDNPFPNDIYTMAEMLADEGYTTTAFITNPLMHPSRGLDQGFENYFYLDAEYIPPANFFTYNLRLYQFIIEPAVRMLNIRKSVEHYYQPAEKISAEVVEYLENEPSRPLFIYIHFFDPHGPYYVHPYNGRGYNPPDADEEMVDLLRDAYIQEIEYMDFHIGQLFNHLRETGLYNNSLIIFTSDHGEEFLDHGNYGHGYNLHDESTKVPLIIKRPGETNPSARIEKIVQTVDIMPTLSNFTGALQSPALPGNDLFDTTSSQNFAFGQLANPGHNFYSIRTDGFLYIKNNLKGNNIPAEQLFDLRIDPLQLNNIALLNDSIRLSHAYILDKTIRSAQNILLKNPENLRRDITVMKSKLEKLGYILP
ncbi:MAG: sulfatase-like hydrolase/transferase [candidate division Zixibacteria bacterium]|nr:sulfatase-like hydrolase/transferase [candidate division Zixibacteria bacterium]